MAEPRRWQQRTQRGRKDKRGCISIICRSRVHRKRAETIILSSWYSRKTTPCVDLSNERDRHRQFSGMVNAVGVEPDTCWMPTGTSTADSNTKTQYVASKGMQTDVKPTAAISCVLRVCLNMSFTFPVLDTTYSCNCALQLWCFYKFLSTCTSRAKMPTLQKH